MRSFATRPGAPRQDQDQLRVRDHHRHAPSTPPPVTSSAAPSSPMEFPHACACTDDPLPANQPAEPLEHALTRLETLFRVHQQDHLVAFLNHATQDQSQSLVNQIQQFESWYDGGLAKYLQKTKQLLRKTVVLDQQDEYQDASTQHDDDEWKDWTPSIPQDTNTSRVASWGSDFLNEMEEIGLQHIDMSCFVIVAGGLGERLGYKGIKLSLPVETITGKSYLEYYIAHFLAVQQYATSRKNAVKVRIPLAIMTSDDTHAATLQLLEKNHYFGMHKSQVTLLKQEKVPCIDLINGKIRLVLDPHKTKDQPCQLLMKPHGHGDVHTLLYQSGLANQWYLEGKRYVHFFQDTNALIVNSINTMVGTSVRYNWQMNSTTVLRKAKDASGAIVKFTNQLLPSKDDSRNDREGDRESSEDHSNCRSHEDKLCHCNSVQERQRTRSMALAGSSVIINIEYNQLDDLLRKKFNPNGDVNEANGYSCFPGNINHLVLALDKYVHALEASKGMVPEFLNPKFANPTTFKAPARLECMMQDYPKLLLQRTQESLLSTFSCNQLGFVMFEPWMVYSPCKNDLASAASKCEQDIPPQCASSAEHDLFAVNASKLRHCGATIGRGPIRRFSGIPVQCGPHILLSSNFALSFAQLQRKIRCPSAIHITGRSTLLIEGDQILLQTLTLDGALKIVACEGAKVLVKHLCVQNAGYVYHEIHQDDGIANPVDVMRGYKIVKQVCKEIIIDTPGDYIIHGDVVVRMEAL